MHKNTWPLRNGCTILCNPLFSGAQKGICLFSPLSVQARIQDFEMGGGGNFCNNVIEPKPG